MGCKGLVSQTPAVDTTMSTKQGSATWTTLLLLLLLLLLL
jgi:hypothetical protein